MKGFRTKGRVWFTSDTHFGHGNIIKYCHRPFLTELDIRALEANGGKWHDGLWKGEFASDHRISRDAIDMMNDHLTDQINKYVDKDDTLFHLGDFAFAQKHKYRHKCEFYRSRIKCKNVVLIEGNHDHIHEITDLFSNVSKMEFIRHEGKKFVLCHYAFAVWDGSHRGTINLYGHSHSTAEEWMNKAMPNRNSFDVGVDNIAKIFGDYRPVSFEEVVEHLKGRSGFWMDHHKAHGAPDPNAPTEEELLAKQGSEDS